MRDIQIHLTSYFNPHFITDEMLTFYHALKDYGFAHTTLEPNKINVDAINILFCGFNLGSNLQQTLHLERPVDKIIVRNLEPVFPTGPCMFPAYFNLMKLHPVWDYAAGNVTRLSAAGIDRVEYVPVSYMPILERIPTTVEEDIDVYFYGYLSPRRQHIIDQLRARGLNVHVNEFNASAAYGELDRLISRAKVILNMTNYNQYHIFEIIRAALPLANHKVVVTELNPYSEIDEDIKQAVLHCPYDQLADFCAAVVANPALREQYAKQGYDIFKQRAGVPIIGAAMERYLAQTPTSSQLPPKSYQLPKQLRLGSGTRWSFDYLNIDTDPNVRSDLTLDIGKAINFSEEFTSWRFGKTYLQAGYFDYINAENVFQSVDDLATAIHNCLYLLAEGGILEVYVPYYLAIDAWRDPKTKRAFSEHGFLFLDHQRFQRGDQKFKLHTENVLFITDAFGDKLHNEQNIPLAELTRIPNAIIGLRFKFSKKRAWTEESAAPINQLFSHIKFHYE